MGSFFGQRIVVIALQLPVYTGNEYQLISYQILTEIYVWYSIVFTVRAHRVAKRSVHTPAFFLNIIPESKRGE